MTDHKPKIFTYQDIESWGPCYEPSRYLSKDWSGTVFDILDKKEVPFQDRLWVILRGDLVSDKLMRLFAVWCARQVQHLMKDERSLKALDVAEAFANGLATKEELDAARTAAGDAARTAAWVAARDAARVAARDAAGVAAGDAARVAARDAAGVAAGDAAWVAARDAARTAARAAAWVAAWVAARDAAWVAAGDAQETKLREMLIAGVETGDVK